MDELNNEKKKGKKRSIWFAFGILAGLCLGVSIAFVSTCTSLSKKVSNLESANSSLSREIEILKTEVNTFTVTYSADNATIASFLINKGGDVPTIPDVPNKKGFDGAWNHDGKNIQSDLVIYANYTPKTFSITYHLNYTGSHFIDGIYTGDHCYFKEVYDYVDCEFYLDLTGSKFVYKGQTYTINDEKTEVLDANDNIVADIYGEMYFDFDGKSFAIEENQLRHGIYSQTLDHNRIFTYDGNSYQLDYVNKKVTRVNDGLVVATLTSSQFDGKKYIESEHKVVSIDDPTISYDVVDNKFTTDGQNYWTIDNHNMIVYDAFPTGSEYIDETKKPTKVSYTYGDDVYLPWDISKNIKYIQTSGNTVIATSATPDMGFRAPQSFLVTGMERFEMTKYENSAFIKNPCSDIDVYIVWAPEYV